MADRERPRNAAPRTTTASAQYKRQLHALFDKGEVPESLKDKLAALESENPDAKARVKLTRAARSAPSGPELVKALDALRAELGAVPEDLELVLRYLEHPSDIVLSEALTHLEKAVELGTPLPKKKVFVTRLEGLQVTSFDPRVQARAQALAARLR